MRRAVKPALPMPQLSTRSAPMKKSSSEANPTKGSLGTLTVGRPATGTPFKEMPHSPVKLGATLERPILRATARVGNDGTPLRGYCTHHCPCFPISQNLRRVTAHQALVASSAPSASDTQCPCLGVGLTNRYSTIRGGVATRLSGRMAAICWDMVLIDLRLACPASPSAAP